MREARSTFLKIFFGRRPTGCRPSDRDGERGFYLVMFVLMLPLMFGIMGLAVDLARYRHVQGEMQNAADAAAFSAARSLNSTEVGRTAATTVASTYARANRVDGYAIATTEIKTNATGRWNADASIFETTNVSNAAANAVRVTVRRDAVRSFFSPILSAALESRAFEASATAVAGGAGAVACAAPLAIASCVLSHDSAGNLVCPTSLSFQNGAKSVGLTHGDGSSPINGNNTIPYFKAALQSPITCDQPAESGTEVYLQNGNDISQTSVNDINAATNNGANPIAIIAPVIDKSCGNNGPTYNQTAPIVGFVKLKIVGARWTGNAPAAVNAACPGLGKKNICVAADCTPIQGAAGGGTIQVDGTRVFLVR
jgi:Flp pilus assembly protein TadG